MATTKSKTLSPVMACALSDALVHGGELIRHAGGYWSYPRCPSNGGLPAWYIGTSTINALHARGHAQWTEWKEGRNGRFPIRATVTLEPVVSEHAQ